ncbi:MAG TPA: carbohydrate ABC transporter permease, partial [Armatimonadota bacterium]|nr:carbohydrate ABC transporter permease [Armatimonadota bacterium]
MSGVPAKKPRRRLRAALVSALLYAVLIAGAVPVLIPFAWMVSSSLKTKELVGENRWWPERERTYLRRADGSREEVTLLVEGRDRRVKLRRADGRQEWVPAGAVVRERRLEPQWGNYGRILSPKPEAGEDDFARFLLNTLVIAGMCVVGQVLSSSLVGWGFARLRFAGKEALFMVMLATMMIPGQIGMIPVFMIFRWLGWIDTFLPLTLPAFFGGGAFFIFLLRQFFLTLPKELEEAARMDGASSWQV